MTSRSRKEKKVSATLSLPVLQQQTHIRLISWSKPIRDSEGRTPNFSLFLLFPNQKRDRVHVEEFQHAQHKSPVYDRREN